MLGILGGMGPLASAEFVQTIYEQHAGSGVEQNAPACVLYSDPAMPDRTAAILGGQDDMMTGALCRALDMLCRLGASRIVIACVTMHHFLPRVALPMRRKVISLVDTVIDELSALRGRHLLLCSTGTRRARIFENHPRWHQIADRVAVPSEADQHALHQMIYSEIKLNKYDCTVTERLEKLQRAYAADGLIAGCTELHLVTRRLPAGGDGIRITDPLLTIAKNIRRIGNA